MDHHVVAFVTWLLMILLATTCTKITNFSEASLVTNPSQGKEVGTLSPTEISTNALRNHQHYWMAGYAIKGPELSRGVRAKLNEWSPHTIVGDHSAAAVIIGARRQDGSIIELAAGWMVNPGAFGDNHRRLFASYMVGDNVPRCYSFISICNGFTISRSSYFTSPRTHTSTHLGQQFEVDVAIKQVPDSTRWNLEINGEIVGYWNDIVTLEIYGGERFIRWAGHVYRADVRFATTAMGSGMFPESGQEEASYIRELQYFNQNYSRIIPDVNSLRKVVRASTQYRVSELHAQVNGQLMFYYGGPGTPGESS